MRKYEYIFRVELFRMPERRLADRLPAEPAATGQAAP